jgi:hypothetical protein
MWVPPYLAEMWEISREWRRSAHLSTPSRQRNLLTPTIQIEKAKTNWHTITTQTAKLEVERKKPARDGGLSCFLEKSTTVYAGLLGAPCLAETWDHPAQAAIFLLTHIL